ncbi:pseudoazurin [Herbaspirillum sp. LeCh32-8]|nr:pseudoazurin [Herbaspirillum sp. LeCh32-8]
MQMLDQHAGSTMLFEPAYLKVAPGDSVTFRPVNRSHYVKAIAAPTGAHKFSSAEDEPLTVKLEQPGLYVYVCPPHLMMAMIGAIQVGEGESVKPQVPAAVKSVRELRSRMLSNGQRAEALVSKMEEIR